MFLPAVNVIVPDPDAASAPVKVISPSTAPFAVKSMLPEPAAVTSAYTFKGEAAVNTILPLPPVA